MNSRYLTKSRFSLALECPTKLFYTGKKEYNQSVELQLVQSNHNRNCGSFQQGTFRWRVRSVGHKRSDFFRR